MQRNPYRLDPKDCPHRSPIEHRVSARLVFVVCQGCGQVLKVWGDGESIAALAAAGLGKTPLVKAVGNKQCDR